PATVTFPDTQMPFTSAPQTVTVKNTGNSPLHVSSVALSGTNAADFAQTNTCVGTAVGPVGTCTVSLTFKPGSAAARSASLVVTDDASPTLAATTQSVPLAGTGTPAPPPPPLPTASPVPGVYATPQSVTLSDTDTTAAIHYTENGSTPTTASTVSTAAPTAVSAAATVTAVAISAPSISSAVASFAYVIAPPPPPPTASPAAGTYTSVQSVVLSDSDATAVIHYTVDGSTPTAHSTTYGGTPISVSSSETVKALAVSALGTPSPVVSFAYVIAPPPPAPTA